MHFIYQQIVVKLKKKEYDKEYRNNKKEHIKKQRREYAIANKEVLQKKARMV